MRYLVSDVGLTLGRVFYAPGSIVDITGKSQADFYARHLVPITDGALLRALETNQDPFYVTAPFRWGRIDREVGDIVWTPNRAAVKVMPKNEDGTPKVRPATGGELLAWVGRTNKGTVPAATAPVRERKTAAASTPATGCGACKRAKSGRCKNHPAVAA